jgi:hypothetical protein
MSPPWSGVRELIAVRAGLGAKGAPSVALFKETRSSRYREIDATLGSLTPKKGREGPPCEL